MCSISRPLTRWFHVLLLVTLLAQLLPPPALVMAAPPIQKDLNEPEIETETLAKQPQPGLFTEPAKEPVETALITTTLAPTQTGVVTAPVTLEPPMPMAEVQAQSSAAICDDFTSGLDGWAVSFATANTSLSNPPGVMRLASSATPPNGQWYEIIAKKTLSGYLGSISVTSVFTSYSETTIHFWVEYADSSIDYIYAYGTTPPTPTGHFANYTTSAQKTPVALYFRAAASWNFPPFQVDNDYVCITDLSPKLPPDQTWTKGGCPTSSCGEQQHFAGDPINTFSGNYSYQSSDITVAAVGQPLKFERTYNSAPVTGTVVYTKPLGYGWTHNYDINLTFPADPGGETGLVILKTPHGSRLRFADNGSGVYTAYPGVWATLTRTGATTSTYVYTVTAANQETYVFTRTGRITQTLDPQGNATNFTYTNGITLTRVTDAASGRYLNFGYNGQGRLTTVTDQTNRTVTYGYDANSNLTTMRDTRGLTWTYTYSGNHYLHRITDPDSKVVEKTFFDSQGRATRQEDGLANPIIQITYPSTYTRVMTEAGKVMTDTYNAQNLLVSQIDALNNPLTYTFDSSFNRTSSADANGNPPTQYARTPLGLTTRITDALNQTTVFTYSTDGRNNLTATRDARGTTTSYTYDTQAQNNLKTVTTVSGTTTYTYNTRGQVTAMTDENNHTTQYGYDSLGQRTVITDALTNITRYGYDSLGRVITVTDALSQVTRNQYDGAGNLTKVTENYRSGQAQNYQNTYNLITTYAYDGFGRQTVMTDTLGRKTRNDYDNAGRLRAVQFWE